MNERLITEFFAKLGKIEGIERELRIESMKNKATCIVGPRKAGKTWFLRMLAKDEMFVNLQDIAFSNIAAEEFFKVIQIYSRVTGKEIKRIFIDEVQEMKGWENLVISLMNRNYEVFLTGSSSKILKKEFSSALRGKNITYLLLPFSFREFLKAKRVEADIRTSEGIGRIQNLLKEYLFLGGYPEVVLNEERKDFLWRSYLDEIFYKDFVERHNIRNIHFGKLLIEQIFQNFSCEISLNKIKKALKEKAKFTDSTLYEYSSQLEETLNVFFVERYSKKARERASWPKKVYVADLGIANIFSFSQDLGKRMENLVFLELLRRTNYNPLIQIFYFKEADSEVDFLIKEGSEIKQLIQVTYASSKDEIEKREIKALKKASESLKCKDLLCITWDYEDELKEDGKTIKFVPLWKWLLSK
jgi:predicted AAA+ superfamily ATPase